MNETATRTPLALGFSVLALLVILGLWLSFRYIDLEQQRDLTHWQARLGLIADTRVADIDHWISQQYNELNELANNASLQLYLGQLSSRSADTGIEPAQLGYLRNLILSSAERSGFYDIESARPKVPANIPTTGHSGLALFDARGKLLIGTPGLPALTEATQATIRRVLDTGQQQLRDIQLTQDGVAVIGFAVPVRQVQGMNGSQQVGVLLGLKDAGQHLYPLLSGRGILDRTDETLLVSERDGLLTYLSPLANDTLPTRRQVALDSPGLAAATALNQPGSFVRRQDYRGIDVLMTSRPVSQAPWTLIQKTDAIPALSESRAHGRFLLTALLLTLLVVTVSLIAAWRHGSSVRARAVAERLAVQSRALERQTRLLHGVTDNIRDLIFLMKPDHSLMFGNRALADLTGIEVADFAGKGLASVIGPVPAERILTHLEQIDAGEQDRHPLELAIADRQGRYQCAGIRSPDPFGNGEVQLVVLHDITELEEAQQKRAALLQQLIKALMQAVDKHDPYSANHSSRVSAVATHIGQAMQLDDADLQALEMAANLANVGKIFIPKETLTKSGELTPEEQALLQKHVDYSLEILSNLEFDGPVLDIIGQKQEHIDGSGYPQGLSGEAILLPARILAVANSFVALVSPRAYRDGIDTQTALDRLLADAGSKYDRQVIAALFHISENMPDWQRD